MTTLKIFASLLFITATLACSKSATDNSVTPVSAGVVTAQVDGQPFASEQATSTYNKVSKDLTLLGYNGIHMMGFTLEKFSGPAVFPLVDISKTGSTGSYVDVKTNANYTIRDGRSGTVTVTKFDGATIEGTFSMTTYNTQQKREVVVSNGTFKMQVESI
ncbi:DUF6252 family protein [uncultured Fibrella sp.]|uniref:DUF6252 family protein n=1 Tax=uncultured Fibrella sp. TaxID=1284596 RepID=UPI0035CB1A70